MLLAGFPCQAFSQAGNQLGFEDTRGTLFFDIARILKYKKPKHIILENVRGLFSHDSGRTFQTILRVLSDIGYMVQWELLNSKNFGVPQNRERIYLVGYLGGRSGEKVFPLGQIIKEDNRENRPLELTSNMPQAYRVYDQSGISTTIKSVGGGVGAKTGLYNVGARFKNGEVVLSDTSTCLDANYYKGFDNMGQRTGATKVKVREATKKGYAIAQEGDSINLSVPSSKTRRGRVGRGIAQTLDTGMQQHTLQNSKIRRLTPVECERLQGMKDDYTKYDSTDKVIANTHRYKAIGNAFNVPVIQHILSEVL